MVTTTDTGEGPNPSPSVRPRAVRSSGRLVGLETEYAIRCGGDCPRPRHDHVYDAIVSGLRHEVVLHRGDRLPANQQVFVENGGAFYYEFQPTHRADGLVEGSTPECRSAAQLLVYQRAQEALLGRAVARARHHLAHQGFFGELALIKNARDAEGHGYGTHENYEVDVATGGRLLALRAGLLCTLPVIIAANLAAWLVALVFIVVVLVGLLIAGLVALVVPSVRPTLARWLDLESRDAPIEWVAGVVSLRITQVLQLPVDLCFGSLYRATFFVPQRRGLMAHLASRMLYAGAGCLMDDQSLWLSERATTLTGVYRWAGAGTTHVVFDGGNLIKSLWAPQFLRFGPLLGLFRRRQRMQIAYSDSNRCQVSEFLKVGTNLLLLDMIDDRRLLGAPRLARPLAAFKALSRDPKTRVRTTDGRTMDAYELQRWYLAEARRYVDEMEAAGHIDLERRDLVDLWSAVLGQLADDPGALVGRVDWITKRYLIEAADLDEDPVARKKIDLRYGELGAGYFDRLDDRGLALRLVEPEEVEAAIHRPPASSPAELRAEVLAELADTHDKVFVAWDRIRVGSWIGGRVIRLEDFWRERYGPRENADDEPPSA